MDRWFAIGMLVALGTASVPAAAEMPMSPVYPTGARKSQPAPAQPAPPVKASPVAAVATPASVAPKAGPASATADVPVATAAIPPLPPPAENAVAEPALIEEAAAAPPRPQPRRQRQYARRQSPGYYGHPAHYMRRAAGYSDLSRGWSGGPHGPSPNGGSGN